MLTRLEANRHRVMRSRSLARSTETRYLKIVAPWVGCAGVEQKGREAWVTPDQWSIYDTTDSYAVANPVRVEHLIVMVPKERLVERGLALDPLMARRLGGSGGVARLALETMRSAYRELPGMSEAAARGVGDAITQLVHLSMLDLAGIGTAVTQSEALRERIKQHVGEHLADPGSRRQRRLALNCSRRHLYNAFAEEPDGVAGYILRAPPGGLLPQLRRPRQQPPLDHRDRARLRLLEHGALQPRVPRPLGVRAERLPAGRGQRCGLRSRVEGRGSLAAVVLRDPGGMLAHAACRDRAPAPQLARRGRPFAAEQGRPVARHRQCPLRRRAVALVGQVGEATVGAGVVVGAEGPHRLGVAGRLARLQGGREPRVDRGRGAGRAGGERDRQDGENDRGDEPGAGAQQQVAWRKLDGGVVHAEYLS